MTVNPKVVAVNVAVTVRAVDIVTAQVPVPAQAPDHPLNAYPEAGVAVSVTEVLAL